MDPKKDWLKASKQTHGDGNLSKQDSIKGKQSQSPISRFGDGEKAQAAPKGKTADKKPAVFGSKSGGGKPNNGPMKTTFTKGLMQKGK